MDSRRYYCGATCRKRAQRETQRAQMGISTVNRDISSTGNDLIATGLSVMRMAVESSEKPSAAAAMRAVRNAVRGRHNWWKRWVTQEHRETVAVQILRESLWLRCLQATVNFMPNTKP
jgi:hypothetical protein